MIWLVSKYALPPKYGAQGRLFYIGAELQNLGHEVLVITSSHSHLAKLPEQKEVYKFDQNYGVNTLFIKGFQFKKSLSKSRVLSWFIFDVLLFYFIFIKSMARGRRPHTIVISSLSLLSIINGIFAKWIFKCKLVFEIRDIWPLSAILIAGYSKYHPFIFFLRFVEKCGYRFSDIVISPLPNLAKHICQSVSKKVDVRYVPHGFSMDLAANDDHLSEEFKNKYIPKDKFLFAYVGNIVEAYDLESLIQSARKIQGLNERIHFLILGDGIHKQNLVESASDLNNITFIPRIPKTQMFDFLSNCHVATNFLRSEPLFEFGVSPQKLVDYMLASKPILMSYTGYKTMVEEIECGFVVEAGNIPLLVDKMLCMFSMKPEQLTSMGERGGYYLKNNLNWKKIVENNLSVYLQ